MLPATLVYDSGVFRFITINSESKEVHKGMVSETEALTRTNGGKVGFMESLVFHSPLQMKELTLLDPMHHFWSQSL